MCIITEFNVQVNKDKVFDIIDCRKDSPVYEEAEKIYNKMLKKSYELVKSIAVFTIKKNEFEYKFNKGCKYSHSIPCLITIGEDISLEIAYLSI